MRIVIGMMMAATLSLTSACGGNPAAKFKGIVDKICECKDMECVQGAQKDLESLQSSSEPTAEQMKEISADMERMQKCIMKVAGGGGDEE